MQKTTAILMFVLSTAVGALFVYSAYTKLIPIESFEYTIAGHLHLPWYASAIAARLLVGLEASLGILIICHLYGRSKWVLKTALLLVVLLSGYLLYLWLSEGDNVNCGCFGDTIWMSPSSSLIKNGLLLVSIFILIVYGKRVKFGWSNAITLFLMMAISLTPFILFAIPSQQPDWLKKEGYRLDLATVHQPGSNTGTNLAKGKYIIAFLSPHCPHCLLAAYKMHIMKEEKPDLPFFMVIAGKSDLTEFWIKTQAQNIPYTRLEGSRFLQLAGNSFPAIYFVNNGWVEGKTEYAYLTPEIIKNWLNNSVKKI